MFCSASRTEQRVSNKNSPSGWVISVLLTNSYNSCDQKDYFLSQVSTYVNLNLMFLKLGSTYLRSYAVWCFLRSTGQTKNLWTPKEFYDLICENFGVTPITAKRWTKAAIKNHFLELCGDRYRLVGKLRVFERYSKDEWVGKAVLVDIDDICTNSLAELRATLYGTQFAHKTKFISRFTLEKLSGKTRATQRKYDRINKQPKKYSFTLENGEVKQKSNFYSRAAKYLTRTKSNKETRYGFYKVGVGVETQYESTNESSPVGPASRKMDALAGKRLVYGDAEKAQEQADSRTKKGLDGVTYSIGPAPYETKWFKKNAIFLTTHIGAY